MKITQKTQNQEDDDEEDGLNVSLAAMEEKLNQKFLKILMKLQNYSKNSKKIALN